MYVTGGWTLYGDIKTYTEITDDDCCFIIHKNEVELIKSCIQNEIVRLRINLYPQDMETTKKIEKRTDDCKELLEQFEKVECEK